MKINHFKKVLIGFFIILALLILSEISLRISAHFTHTGFIYDESYLGKKPAPFSYQFGFQLNSKGFKGKEFGPYTVNDFKIIAIGDSFTFAAVPQPQSYIHLIEQNLQMSSPAIHLLNLGIPGASPEDYLSMFVHEGLQYRPNMLLLTLFIGDDIFQSPPKKWRKKLYISKLFSYVKEHYKNREQLQVGTKSGSYCDTCPATPEDSFTALMTERSNLYQTDSRVLQSNSWQMLKTVRKINNICENNNIELVVIIAPDVFQIDTALQKKLTEKAQKWHVEEPNRLVSQALDELNIQYLDLLPQFIDNAIPLYLPHDVHWNIAGNELAAAQVSKFIGSLLTRRFKN